MALESSSSVLRHAEQLEGESSEVRHLLLKIDEQRAAVKKIRMLSKESPENRISISNSGGIPLLVHLLSYRDSRIQEHAITDFLKLYIDESNKKFISREESIPAIIEAFARGIDWS
ncbi:U-box domain-containing protein 15 [Forsythia ovata]|uniref:U-box domain-containing protein 15 n=1 Tax=Forsythia ovata TaxID=205694 RepID=A0ABD1UYC7_9LAMI